MLEPSQQHKIITLRLIKMQRVYLMASLVNRDECEVIGIRNSELRGISSCLIVVQPRLPSRRLARWGIAQRPDPFLRADCSADSVIVAYC